MMCCLVCSPNGVLFVRCAVLMVCCLYGVKSLWCAVTGWGVVDKDKWN